VRSKKSGSRDGWMEGGREGGVCELKAASSIWSLWKEKRMKGGGGKEGREGGMREGGGDGGTYRRSGR